jgi:DNA-binding CsgD family transcriptional regulator
MRRAYAVAVRRRSINADDLGAELGLGRQAATQVLDDLCELRLLHPEEESGGRLAAVAPESARLQLLRPMERELMARQEAIDGIEADLASLTSVFATASARSSTAAAVELVRHGPTARTLIAELAGAARQEMLAAQPGALAADQLDEAQVLARGRDGDRPRLWLLYQHSAQYNHDATTLVLRLGGIGTEVRTTANGFTRMLVFDREVAVLGLRDGSPGAAVVRDEQVVATLAEAFDRTWHGARPFPLQHTRGQTVSVSCEVKQAIVRLLVSGESDRKIAAHIGLSLRTCQRHIAELMRAIGAQNRLHAGYLLYEQLAKHDADTAKIGGSAAALRGA